MQEGSEGSMYEHEKLFIHEKLQSLGGPSPPTPSKGIVEISPKAAGHDQNRRTIPPPTFIRL